jgi:hypothetical protein
MLKLVKHIQGEVTTEHTGSVKLTHSVSGEIQGEDFINLYGFVAYLQNFSRIEETAALVKPSSFGLKNEYDVAIKDIEINY